MPSDRQKFENYELPEVILHPPEKYDKIVNKFGVCGKKPNLKFNGIAHRYWVLHAVDGVRNAGSIDEYVKRYLRSTASKKEFEEFKEATKQAIEFYEEYTDVFEEVREYRDYKIAQFKENNSTLSPPD